MLNKNILFVIFLIVVIVQLFVPAKIIYDSEDILADGKEFKFRTAPIDPIDPLRGKYIFLQFKENSINVNNSNDWANGETIFVSFENDENGFAKIKSIHKEKPEATIDFVKSKITMVFQNKVTVIYPFDRYYMEETKAGKAEIIYNNSIIDTNKITYALVSVKNGNAIIKNIYIDEIPITEYIKNNNH